MPERPKWLKIVGGTDHNPVESVESTPEVSYKVLVDLWVQITSKLSVDYKTAVTPEKVREATLRIRPWTVGQLYAYLSRPDIWHRPAFTKAVIEEVADRMQIANFSPRE